MSEGPIVGNPTRGKRNTALAQKLAQEKAEQQQAAAEALAEQLAEEAAEAEALGDEMVTGAGEEPMDAGFTMVRAGRVVFAKTTSPLRVDDGEAHWFTFGITDHVDPDADLGEVFEEVRDITNSAVLGMAADMAERMAEARRQPIRPRR